MLGTYPTVSLKDARNKRDETRMLLANGVDPEAKKKRLRLQANIAAANAFRETCDDFIDLMEREGHLVATVLGLSCQPASKRYPL